MAGDGQPLAALPNIGLASLAGGRVIYPHATPEYFAEFAAHARELGARIDRRLLRDDADRDRRDPLARSTRSASRARALDFDERELVVSLGEEQRETRLARALREGEWVVSIQLDPPLGGDIGGLVELSRRCKDVRHGRLRRHQRQRDGARAGMSAMMVSAAIEREAGSRRSRT